MAKYIDITTLRTKKKEENEIIFNKVDDIIELINERLKDIKEIKKLINLSDKEIFEKFWSPDTIVIEGGRGSGKTTQMLILKEYIEKKQYIYDEQNLKVKLNGNIFMLDFIDSTNLTDKVNILQVLFRSIDIALDKYKNKNRRLYNSLKEKVQRLSMLIAKIENIENIEDTYELRNVNYNALNLPFEIHKLAKEVCYFLKVDALILMIDDLNLNVKNTNQVLSSLKDFFSTPYVIPIVAFNSPQILAIIKKEKYEFFGLKIYENPQEKSEKLEFLEKLPYEWLQRIFPPSRVISLPDMLKIFQDYLKNLKDENDKIYFVYQKNDIKLKLEFKEAVRLYISIVYGWDIGESTNSKLYENLTIDYLKNLSLRDFLNDIRALMRGLLADIHSKNNEENEVDFKVRYLKYRLKPYYLARNIHKEDSIRWFWEKYIQVFNKRYNEGKNLKDIVAEIIDINEKENRIISKEEKTFFRILLQSHYIEKTLVKLKRKNGYLEVAFDKDNGIKKEINVSGLLRLLLRTIIPAYTFYWLVKENYIDFEQFDTSEFNVLFDYYITDTELETFYKNIVYWTIKYGKNKTLANGNNLSHSPYFIRLPNVEAFDEKYNFIFNTFLEGGELNSIFKIINKFREGKEEVYFSPFAIFLNALKFHENKSLKGNLDIKYDISLVILRKILKNYTKNLIDVIEIFNKNINVYDKYKLSIRDDYKFLKYIYNLVTDKKGLNIVDLILTIEDIKEKDWSLIIKFLYLSNLNDFNKKIKLIKDYEDKFRKAEDLEKVFKNIIKTFIKDIFISTNNQKDKCVKFEDDFFDILNIFITKRLFTLTFFMSYILPIYHFTLLYIKESNKEKQDINYNLTFTDGFIPKNYVFELTPNFNEFYKFVDEYYKIRENNIDMLSFVFAIFKPILEELLCSDEFIMNIDLNNKIKEPLLDKIILLINVSCLKNIQIKINNKKLEEYKDIFFILKRLNKNYKNKETKLKKLLNSKNTIECFLKYLKDKNLCDIYAGIRPSEKDNKKNYKYLNNCNN